MRRPELGIGAASLVFLSTLSWVSARADERVVRDPIVTRIIGTLNERIQERFKDINNGFGISRLMRPERLPHRLEPETVSEMAVVRELERTGFGVILYLGSHRGSVKGPVLVTRLGSNDGRSDAPGMPDPSELHDTNRRGIQAFGSADAYEFTVPGWKFISYPVRASSQTCLACHALRLGDPIGTVMYGYREIRRP